MEYGWRDFLILLMARATGRPVATIYRLAMSFRWVSGSDHVAPNSVKDTTERKD